ncbi:MAG: sensor histidine kinase [Mobilitalea sp.]
MKYLLNKLQEIISKKKISSQLYLIYTLTFFVPMVCISAFLLLNTSRLLSNYYGDLSESNNLRVKTILFEITTQIYNISEEIAFNSSIQELLSVEHSTPEAYLEKVVKYQVIGNYSNNYSEIDDITVYSDNPSVQNYQNIVRVDDEITATDWYQKALGQSSVFWISMKEQDRYGNDYYNLCLVRKIPLMNSENHAVLTIKISENHLKSRMDTNNYETVIYINEGDMFFSSNRLWYGLEHIIPVDYSEEYFQFKGKVPIEDKQYLTSISTLNLYQSDSRAYVCNLNHEAYDNIYQILILCLLIIGSAILLPFFLIRYYTVHFTGRVGTLREAMHKASNDNYDVPVNLKGEDEISQAFRDLLIMLTKIKDKDAKMYEARINAQKLQNEQQKMEMEMLASQINPHFLYNTLETIRMKAFTAGDRDVATAIKLLGKSMRYVLENTGTASTTLKNELDYIETYLQIQRLRFADKVNYSFNIEEAMNPEEYDILPLLLQPIVENAILHGLADVEMNGQITIDVYSKEKEYLLINITDNGSGMSPEELELLRIKVETPYLNPNRSIGLYNINQRIRLCYGDRYGMVVNSTIGIGTIVSLTLPLKINIETA